MTAAEREDSGGEGQQPVARRMRPVNFRLSPEQRASLLAEAAAANMSLSDWMRYKLGFEVALPDTDRPQLIVPDELMGLLNSIWPAAGYVSLEEFVAACLEDAAHRELRALHSRLETLAEQQVAVLGVPTRKFVVQQVACRHPQEAREYRGGVGFCNQCGGRIGRA